MRIGELSRLTGISTRTLRHYDSIGVLSPASRAANGYREYDGSDISWLLQVEALKTLGLSLDAVRATLDNDDVAPADLIDDLIEKTRSRMAREQQLIARLESVRESEAASWDDALGVIALLQGLDSPDPSRRQQVALADSDAAPASALVEALLSEADPNVAGAMSWAVARSGVDAVPALADALHAPDEHVRLRAITALVRLDAEHTRPVLKGALRHPDQRITDTAALTLGTRGHDDAVPELVDMIVRGSHDVDAAEALGHLAREHDSGDHLSEVIGDQLTSTQTPGSRGRLTQALGDIPGPRAGKILAELVTDDDGAVSMTARYLLTLWSDE